MFFWEGRNQRKHQKNLLLELEVGSKLCHLEPFNLKYIFIRHFYISLNIIMIYIVYRDESRYYIF